MIKFHCWATIIMENLSVCSCKFDKYIYCVNVTNWSEIWTTLPDSSMNVHYCLSLFDIDTLPHVSELRRINYFVECYLQLFYVSKKFSNVFEWLLRRQTRYYMRKSEEKLNILNFQKKRTKIEFFQTTSNFSRQHFTP